MHPNLSAAYLPPPQQEHSSMHGWQNAYKLGLKYSCTVGVEIAEKPFKQGILTLTQQGDALCMVHAIDTASSDCNQYAIHRQATVCAWLSKQNASHSTYST